MKKLPWNKETQVSNLSDSLGKLNSILGSIFNQNLNSENLKHLLDIQSDAKLSELQKRGTNVFFNTLGEKQGNIEEIISKSIKYLPPESPSSTELPDRNWILDFFDLCQNCSDTEIQEIWAKLLAYKVDNPNSHSRRLMHTIRMLEPNEATTFNNMAKCVCEITIGSNIEGLDDFGSNFGTVWVAAESVLIDEEDFEFNINYDTCLTLEEMGLLSNKEYDGADNLLSEIAFLVDNEKVIYKLNEATISIFEFTKIGFELFEIANHELNQSYKGTIIQELELANMIKK